MSTNSLKNHKKTHLADLIDKNDPKRDKKSIFEKAQKVHTILSKMTESNSMDENGAMSYVFVESERCEFLAYSLKLFSGLMRWEFGENGVSDVFGLFLIFC